MDAFKNIFGKEYVKVKLSALWIFVMLNYIYADILTLMDSSVLNEILSGVVGGNVQITPMFLFMGAVMMEIPIAMIVLSLVLKYKINRWANIVAGVIKTAAVFASMFVGVPAAYYIFFGIIEIITTLYIIRIAWKWSNPETSSSIPN
jgi:hypothetical protein